MRNIYMGPSAQKHSLDDFIRRQFRHRGLASSAAAGFGLPRDLEAGPIGRRHEHDPPPGTPRWGAAYRDFLAKYLRGMPQFVAQTENLPYADQTMTSIRRGAISGACRAAPA